MLSLMLLSHSDKLLLFFFLAGLTDSHITQELCCAGLFVFLLNLTVGPWEQEQCDILLWVPSMWLACNRHPSKQLLTVNEFIDPWGNVCIAFSILTPHSAPTSDLIKEIEITVGSWNMAWCLLGGKAWRSKPKERNVGGFPCSIVQWR